MAGSDRQEAAMAIDPAELIDAPGGDDRLRSSLEREAISALQLVRRSRFRRKPRSRRL
jgi:hypothetical protein